MVPRLIATVLALLLAAVAAAPAAHGATASLAYASEEGFSDVFVVFRAAPGERNRVTVTTGRPNGAAQTVRFTDAGAAVRAGRGCLQVSARVATCSTARYNGQNMVSIFAGDRDDRIDLRSLRLSGFTTSVEGEAGGDTVLGSRAMVNQINGTPCPTKTSRAVCVARTP